MNEFYPQDNYWKRLEYFIKLTNPLNLLTTDKQLEAAKTLIQRDIANNQFTQETANAQILLDATLHPDTGKKIFLPCRMASFVPTNLVILIGLLIPNPSISTLLFWQWANQSVNVAINWANANKSNPMSLQEIALAYGQAVAASCSIALGMTHFARRAHWLAPMARKIVEGVTPFTAVAAAGTINVYLMRWNELRNGIDVKDENGNVLGKSKVAASEALKQVAISRIATSFPALTIPPLFLSFVEKAFPRIKNNPRSLAVIQLTTITSVLMTALPCAIALFPQKSAIPVSKLEPNFYQSIMLSVRNDNANANANNNNNLFNRNHLVKEQMLYFNKGL